jgi:ankyrin repeat protein
MPVGLDRAPACGACPSLHRARGHTGKHGITALHYAAHYGNRRIVRLLIGANAAVNAQDNSE